MPQWTLPAASGRDRLVGEFQWRKNVGGGAVLCAAITLTGSFWERQPGRTNDSVVDDYTVSLSQVMLNWSAVDDLIFQLAEWIDQPKAIEIDLCEKSCDDQMFTIAFGKVDWLITTNEKPACTITYSGTAFRNGIWSFIVD